MNLATTTCECSSACGASGSVTAGRKDDLARALRLEYLTVGWNTIEGVIAVGAAMLAGSVALLGFGVDSFVECASGIVMVWRLRAEGHAGVNDVRLDALEQRAQKLVAITLIALAAYVAFEAIGALWSGEHPQFTSTGIVLTGISLVVMTWLARAKREVARALGSGAMEADAFQTTACIWLSIATLAGIALNGALGWWWADPVAALVIAALLVKEGREAWEGKHACC